MVPPMVQVTGIVAYEHIWSLAQCMGRSCMCMRKAVPGFGLESSRFGMLLCVGHEESGIFWTPGRLRVFGRHEEAAVLWCTGSNKWHPMQRRSGRARLFKAMRDGKKRGITLAIETA